MGLDMFLERRSYIKRWDHIPAEQQHVITITKEGKDTKIKPERISYIIEEIQSWRKANAIHQWFVKNVQEGKDDCREYTVSLDQLKQLVETCEEVINASELIDGKINNGYTVKDGKDIPILVDGKLIKDPAIAEALLPTQKGFFFGSTDYDEYYIQDLINTVEVLKPVIAESTDMDDFTYHSSW